MDTASDSSLDITEELNEIVAKPFIKVSEMEFGRHYKVIKAARCSTKFGEKVTLEFENEKIFMPSRYDKLSDAALERINTGGEMYITNEGEDGNQSYKLKFCRPENLPASAFYAKMF